MQIVVVVVDEVGGVLRILDEPLEGVAGEELPVGLLDAPIELAEELSGLRLREEVHLAGEGVEELVLSRRDVPPAVPQLGIELGHDLVARRDGIAPVVLLLRDAVHVGHGALVELPDDLVLEDVAALDLAARLVGGVVAGVDADDVGQALGVGDALGERDAALLEEAADDLLRRGGVGRPGRLDRRERASHGIERQREGQEERRRCLADARECTRAVFVAVFATGLYILHWAIAGESCRHGT